MATSYELIDFESGNLIGSYATEDAARAVVRRAHEAEGPTAVQGLGLIRVEDGDQALVAEDLDLVRDAVMPANAPALRP